MKTATELFENFLDKEAANNFAYHLYDVRELRQERTEVAAEIEQTKEEIADLYEALEGLVGGTDEMDLAGDLETSTAILTAMDKVLAFVGDAVTGTLITKVVTTQEWQYQEPIYYTANDEVGNIAFTFFNAHAVITDNQE